MSTQPLIKSDSRAGFLFNLIAFQIVWTATVLGSAYLLIWPALILCALFTIIHFKFFEYHPSDLKLVAIGVGIGLVLDTIWIQSNQLSFTDQRPFEQLTPLWMLVLWVGFSLTLNHSLGWLKRHPILPILFGFFGAPFSYYIGSRLGAVEYLAPFSQVSLLLAVTWAVAIYSLIKVAQRY
jgi:hypothetical protein